MTDTTKLALTAGAVVAAIELPISRYYATIPPTGTGKRMAIAGAMAVAGVMVASALLKRGGVLAKR